jgi:hypothetical protein
VTSVVEMKKTRNWLIPLTVPPLPTIVTGALITGSGLARTTWRLTALNISVLPGSAFAWVIA